MNRYAKQLALPELTDAHQQFLKNTKILMVGAGGLGAAALPYLAGTGIGHITIVDRDVVDITNLHRQTIYKTSDAGKHKATIAADYLKDLNPEITVHAITEKFKPEYAQNFDLLLDGSDNFDTKFLLNETSIKTKTPLITAAVEGFGGIAGIFAGFADAPCYGCLHPEIPLDACNCNDAGILGTSAGLAGMYQAHLTLCFLLGLGDVGPGTLLSFDFKNMRVQNLRLPKNPECEICAHQTGTLRTTPPALKIIPRSELGECVIVDVRTDEEVAADPIPGAVHIPMHTIPSRHTELPRNKKLALVCAHNVRSAHVARYLQDLGYEDVCVMDKLRS